MSNNDLNLRNASTADMERGQNEGPWRHAMVMLLSGLGNSSASHSTTVAAVQGCLDENDKERRAQALELKSSQARAKKLKEDLRAAHGQLTLTRVRDSRNVMHCKVMH